MFYFIGAFGRECLSGARKNSNCYVKPFCTDKCLDELVDGKLQCSCGEDVPVFEWSWSEEYNCSSAKFSKENKEILFHPVYSSGTAAVKGSGPFQQNLHYYWEVKMISKLYGTDVMVGIGTSKVDVVDWRFKFCSMLGIDSNSWGYSYHGEIQHDKLRRKYGCHFGLGSIIGIHLDMCSGTLEYYINRKPLGVAFTGLKGQQLYPMVSSTAAQSAVRITCAVSQQPTLQMMCLKYIMKNPLLHKRYRSIPGLTRQYDKQYFWMVPTNEPDEKKRLADLDEDVTLSLVDKSYLGEKNKRFKGLSWQDLLIGQDSDDSMEGVNVWIDEGSNSSLSSDTSSSSNSSSSGDLQSGSAESDPGTASTSGTNCDESQMNLLNELEDSDSSGDSLGVIL